MDRYWLLTTTLYGNWLPGDVRGSVTSVADQAPHRLRHNRPGSPVDGAMPGLRRSALQLMKAPPVRLELHHAEVLLAQFQETAHYRHWSLLAAAILYNHIHLVVAVADDPEPATILQSFKSYGARALNRAFAKPPSGTWWTEGGSMRKLPDDNAVRAAIHYVEQQERPLRIWVAERLPMAGEQATGGERGTSVP